MVKYAYMSNLERFKIIQNNEVIIEANQVYTQGTVYDKLKEIYGKNLNRWLNPRFGCELIFVTCNIGDEDLLFPPNNEDVKLLGDKSINLLLKKHRDTSTLDLSGIAEIFQIIEGVKLDNKSGYTILIVFKYPVTPNTRISYEDGSLKLCLSNEADVLILNENHGQQTYINRVRFNFEEPPQLESYFMPNKEILSKLLLEIQSHTNFKNHKEIEIALGWISQFISDKMIVTNQFMLASGIQDYQYRATMRSSAEIADVFISKDFNINPLPAPLFSFLSENYIAICDALFGLHTSTIKYEVITEIQENINHIKNRLSI